MILIYIAILSFALWLGYQFIQYQRYRRAEAEGKKEEDIKKNRLLEGASTLSQIGGILCVGIVVLVICLSKWISYIDNHPPRNSHYIKMLEQTVGEKLPSCKVLAKTYRAGLYEGVVFQMQPKDYEKVRQAFESQINVTISTPERVDFNSMKTMLKEVLLKPEHVKERYLGIGEWGLKPTDVVLYQRWL